MIRETRQIMLLSVLAGFLFVILILLADPLSAEAETPTEEPVAKKKISIKSRLSSLTRESETNPTEFLNTKGSGEKTRPRWQRRFHLLMGLGFAGDQLGKGSEFGKLGVGIGDGAVKQEMERWNNTEINLKNSDPSMEQGGCPDIPAVTLRTPKTSGEQTIPAQRFTIQGKRCAMLDGRGSGMSFLGADIDLRLRYDLSRWSFVETGLTWRLIAPLKYAARFRFLGSSDDINIQGLTDPLTGAPIDKIGADILIDSTAYTEHNLRWIQVPLNLGINFFRTERAQMYLSFGLLTNLIAYQRHLRASQDVTLSADGKIIRITGNYEDVEATEKALVIGGTVAVGCQYRFNEKISLWAEIHWLKGSAKTSVSGTTVEAGHEYASDTFAAKVLNQIADGAAAEVLRSDSNPNGARTVNGLNIGFNAGWLIGIIYTL